MSDEQVEGVEFQDKRGPSRRAALKAGVAVGVGAVAWSGASITSLGGTPAYAITVSGITKFDLGLPCRNTDQGTAGCPETSLYRYHPLTGAALPAGFCIANNPLNGTCCGIANPPELRWDVTTTGPLQCAIVIDSYQFLNNCKDLVLSARNVCGCSVSAPGSTCVSSVMPCNPAGIDPQTFYTIYAVCRSGAPPPCPEGTCTTVVASPCGPFPCPP